MATEENWKTARRLMQEAWNQGNLDALDKCCAPSYPQRGAGSEDLKAGMMNAGVIGTPEFWYGEDIEHTPY